MPFEQNLWRWLREKARPLTNLHLCRVENTVGWGYPDVEGCLDGRQFHVELKGALKPKKPETPVRIHWQPGQKLWLKTRWSAGGSCSVLIRVGSGRRTRKYLIRGDQVDNVGDMTEEELAAISYIDPFIDDHTAIHKIAQIRILKKE
jgi:hypothetical protein